MLCNEIDAHSPLSKTVGYNHFCQTPHCKHESCNKCQLYSNAEEDDMRASREAGLKAVQELKGHHKTGDIAEKMESILNEEEKNSKGASKSGGARNNQRGHQRADNVRARLAAAGFGGPPGVAQMNPAARFGAQANGALQAIEAANQALQNVLEGYGQGGYGLNNNPGYMAPMRRRR